VFRKKRENICLNQLLIKQLIPMANVCIHYYVVGKVQGVWFRAATEEQANRLGIVGWVRNLPDGRVEVVACGKEENVARFQAWLKKGPEAARVDDLISEILPWREHQQFDII
jgi:acylphosphatase